MYREEFASINTKNKWTFHTYKNQISFFWCEHAFLPPKGSLEFY